MNIRRNRPISPFSYAGKGFVSCKDGIVTISTTDQTENRSTAFTVADGRVEVATRNVKEERLKAADRDEADEKAALTAFYNYYKAAEACSN
jgi:hypothetical protein